MTQRCIAGGIWSKTISPKSRSSAPSPRDTTRQSKASAPTSTLPLRSSPQGKCQQTLRWKDEAMSLQGKVALVTGSTSGIGLGIARALAASGADIMLNGFGDAAQIEAVRGELAATHGVKVAYDGADISKPEQIAAMVANTAKTLGAVDILVNNAGIQFTATVEEFPNERWDQIIAINL